MTTTCDLTVNGPCDIIGNENASVSLKLLSVEYPDHESLELATTTLSLCTEVDGFSIKFTI